MKVLDSQTNPHVLPYSEPCSTVLSRSTKARRM